MHRCVLVSLFLVLVLAVAMARDPPYCAIGRHLSNGQCHVCFRGNFCPGDDKYYKCEGDSVAPGHGMAKCEQCTSEKPFANPMKTFCMFSDKPADLEVTTPSHDKPVLLNEHGAAHFALEYSFDVKKVISFSAYSNATGNIEFFLSTRTAKPDAQNYQIKSAGNPTVAEIDKDLDPNAKYPERVVYVTVQGAPKSRVELKFMLFNTPIVLLKGTTVYSYYFDRFSLPHFYYQFTVPHDGFAAKVRFALLGHDPLVRLHVSNQRPLPNPFKNDKVVTIHAPRWTWKSTDVEFNNLKAGTFYIDALLSQTQQLNVTLFHM